MKALREMTPADPSFLDSELSGVRLIMEDSAQIADPRSREAIGALLGAGGKLLRPRILILSALTGNYRTERIRPLAAAVELLHAATLLHDDVIDDSPFRRGLPAAHERIGRKHAVLAGDFLFSRCFLLASGSSSPENALLLARAIGVIVSAEIEQDRDRWVFRPGRRSCLRKIGGKTAALFSLSARSGATAAGAPKETVSALTRAAWAAGVAFQIQDDILDWSGDERNLGKAVFSDLSGGLCTLPLALALEREGGRLLPLLSPAAVAAGSTAGVAELVRVSGALDEARRIAHSYLDRSLSSLGRIPPSPARDGLARIFGSFVGRQS